MPKRRIQLSLVPRTRGLLRHSFVNWAIPHRNAPMPAIKPESKVLVTGASGFIASWVTKILLERGFHVRGTVRSAAKGEYLANLFKEHAARFEYVIIEDVAKVDL